MKAQKFDFSIRPALVFSQVDGDNLSGFKKFGYNFGISTSYAFSPNWNFFSAQGFTRLGSSRTPKDLRSAQEFIVDVDLLTANIQFGFIYNLTEKIKEGRKTKIFKNSRFKLGPKFHHIFKTNLDFFSRALPLAAFETLELKTRFFSMNLSYGQFISQSLLLEIQFERGLSNIIDQGTSKIEKFSPYFIALGFEYKI